MASRSLCAVAVVAAMAGPAAAEPEDVVAQLRIAEDAERRGDHAEAERQYRAAVERWPEKGGAHYHLGRFFKERGRYGEALRELDVVLTIGKPADRLDDARRDIYECL